MNIFNNLFKALQGSSANPTQSANAESPTTVETPARADEVTISGDVAPAANPNIESKTSYKSGVAGVFNPSTGETQWKESYKSGVAGVYNPSSGQVEWKESYKSGVAGVYNESSGQVEWKEFVKW